MHRTFGALVFLILSTSVSAQSFLDNAPERRKDQFPKEFAYLLAPLPYSMPGIGEGYFIIGYLSNMFDTTADAAIVSVQGDAAGTVSQLDEIPLMKDRVHLHIMDMDINKATISDYSSRGMDGNSDYNLVKVTDVKQQQLEVTMNFWERRLGLIGRYDTFSSTATELLDEKGNSLGAYQSKADNISRSIGAFLDLTDDYNDPRQGLRLHLDYTDHPAKSSTDPNYFVMDYNLLYYMPFNKDDTIVFNYLRSDAHVRSQGLTDFAQVLANLEGGTCAGDPACLAPYIQRANNTVAANRYGTAMSLGGTDHLRSYADGRFAGGHMEFIGVELRSNFVRDAEPFDYFIWKDIRTSIQLALFAELGTVAETRSNLWKDTRSSVGIGARLVTASGSVYRVDWATGDEGSEFTVFFFYPWK